ncbi:MAG: hydrogenase nickel incorporation protein HypA [Candidatus Syntropharchaeales archaeon]|nr:hydrogenase nickel incorporation protein HypA [Candidatus Syntrophoarchaeum sp.]
MHEWSVAEAVIETVLAESVKAGLDEVTEVRINIGELQQIEKEVFEFALEEIRKVENPKLLQNAKIRMEIEKGVFKCRICGDEWNFDELKLDADEYEAIHVCPEVSHVYIRCPSCRSPDFELIKGRGVSIASIKGRTKE